MGPGRAALHHEEAPCAPSGRRGARRASELMQGRARVHPVNVLETRPACAPPRDSAVDGIARVRLPEERWARLL